jgi:sugar phosphate isomerase/epimerase
MTFAMAGRVFHTHLCEVTGDRHDRMIVGFTTTYGIYAYHH